MTEDAANFARLMSELAALRAEVCELRRVIAKPQTRLLSRTEAAEYVGLPPRTFDMHVRGEVPEVSKGRRVLFAVDDLDRWVATQRHYPVR